MWSPIVEGLKEEVAEENYETKICETCKNEKKEPDENPCDVCYKASKWESKKEGCEFCLEEKEEIRSNIGFSIDIDNDLYVRYFEGVIDKVAYLPIDYCPLCGRKL